MVLNHLKELDETKSEQLMKIFDLFLNTVIEYIKSYFDDDSEFYEKLSFFSAQSIDFLTWKNVIDVADAVHIHDLDEDQLYSEFCDIKCLYDNLKKKNIKLSDQVKSYISSKTIDFSASEINHQNVTVAHNDHEDVILLSNKQDENFIRSDHLWAYILNINSNSTPNLKKNILYLFYSMFKFFCRINFQPYEIFMVTLS